MPFVGSGSRVTTCTQDDFHLFLRTLALPEEMENWSLTTIREKVVKIGAKVVTNARYATF